MGDQEKSLFENLNIHKKTFLRAWKLKPIQEYKNASIADNLRKEGNRLFINNEHNHRMHYQILEHYCKSLAFAPMGSKEFVFANANLSAFLVHVKKYEECIDVIDSTLGMTKSLILKIKLLCRKMECLKQLGSHDYKKVLDEAKESLTKLDKDELTQGTYYVSKSEKACKLMSILNSNNYQINVAKSTQFHQEPDDVEAAISVNYNDKFGTHLIAKRLFKPGKIIFVDQVYDTVLDAKKKYTNCSYCFKILWKAIPCNKCNNTLYCSTNCQEEAWSKYHDTECSLIPQISLVAPGFINSYHLCVRLLVKGLKETKKISILKNKVEHILKGDAQDNNNKVKKFMKNNFESVYTLKASLSNNFISRNQSDAIYVGVWMAIVCFVKHSFLNEQIQLKSLKSFMIDEDVIFLAKLLLNLCSIKDQYGLKYQEVQNGCLLCDEFEKYSESYVDDTNESFCMSPLTSLINHSCQPNAMYTYLNNRKIAVVALGRIKKNSQIFINYIPQFFNLEVKYRHEELKKFNLICDCNICEINMPQLGIPWRLYPSHLYVMAETIQNKTFMKIVEKCKDIFWVLTAGGYLNRDAIPVLSKAITEASISLPQPNILSYYLQNLLQNIILHVHGIKFEKFYENCNTVRS
ncbi:hypothetical protein TKK_0007205 [Trichogramma kaykai]|uniref:MYND-type domain-containing protein n=1 Tax=Trichogramma kaykai TaxID=54128 RepID=A0ABD2XA67_9HYME